MCTSWFSFVSNHQTDVTSFDQFLKLILKLIYFIILVRVRVGVRVGAGFRLVTQPFNTSSENDVTSVRLLEISAD